MLHIMSDSNTIPFYKMDGAGNDFVLIDARRRNPGLSAAQIARICHRRFGVGADGLMLLLPPEHEGSAFTMAYYNSDGGAAEMCGNGGRCIALFYRLLNSSDAPIAQEPFCFYAADGPHEAAVLLWDNVAKVGLVRLGMKPVAAGGITRVLDGWLLNTGVPHYVQRVEDLAHFDVAGEGRRLRHHPAFGTEGANVNFIEDAPDGTLCVRTYERGVEDETWACGTGVTACAIVTGNQRLRTRGGDFKVTFSPTGAQFQDIQLTGPVALNFTGTIPLQP